VNQALSASQPNVEAIRGFLCFPSPFPLLSLRGISKLRDFNLIYFKHSAPISKASFAMSRPFDDDEARYFKGHFAKVRQMLYDRTVEEFSQLLLVERKSIFRQYLVQKQRVIINECDDDNELNPAIANGVLLLQTLFMGKDEKGKQMVKEAREVHYGENEFRVSLYWLCEFRFDPYELNQERFPIAF
jgi:hypothetical protein